MPNPRTHCGWSFGMSQFFSYAGGNQNGRKEAPKYVNGFNQNQIVEWTGVGDNRLHLCAEASEGCKIALKVFGSVFEFDAALLEEAIHFHARLEAEQAAQLGVGNLALSVGLCGKGFQSGAGEVAAGRSKRFLELLRKANRDVLHTFSLPKMRAKSTNHGAMRTFLRRRPWA